jgi:hypothetical protein
METRKRMKEPKKQIADERASLAAVNAELASFKSQILRRARISKWIRHLAYVVSICCALGMAIYALQDAQLPLDYVRAFIGAAGVFALAWGSVRLVGWVIEDHINR